MSKTLTNILITLIFVNILSIASAAFVEDFDSKTVDESHWQIKTVGKASFTIEDSLLKLESPDVTTGVIFYHTRNLQDVDIVFEVKLDLSEMGENVSLGFIAAMLEPQNNTEINNNLEATFYFVQDRCYIKQDPVVIGEKPPNPAGLEGQYEQGSWNTVVIDYSNSRGEIVFYINGKELGKVEQNKEVKERFFYITCDPYTSHYTGSVTIDYIEISGPGADAFSVIPKDKLAITWGDIKRILY